MNAFKYLADHGPVLRGLGKTTLGAVQQGVAQLMGSPAPARDTRPPGPGPELTAVLPPRRAALVQDYLRHVGGDRAGKSLPPHLFPQWAFGLAAETLIGIPYPIAKVMNGGCSVTVAAPLPADEPLHVRVCLESIDDDGRRAVLCQRVITGTPSSPDALTARLYAVVPLGDPKAPKKAGGSRERPRVPAGARELARWRLPANAGLDFAALTGDFNPVHWIAPYARAFGFKNTILHGFSTMARAWEGVQRHLWVGTREIAAWDVKFTRPLVLPARVGLYVAGDTVAVGDAPGGPAYMLGTFK